MLKKTIITSALYTAITAVLLGLVYPLVLTGVAKLVFPRQASGQIVQRDGVAVGSALLGQPFTGATYFHSRPSAAGSGYDAASSSGSNLAPSSKSLIDRVTAGITAEGDGSTPVPVDLVTTSASGLDPDITPAAAAYQVPRIARNRKLPIETVQNLVRDHTIQRQFGLLGEPRVNVLALNLALDQLHA